MNPLEKIVAAQEKARARAQKLAEIKNGLRWLVHTYSISQESVRMCLWCAGYRMKAKRDRRKFRDNPMEAQVLCSLVHMFQLNDKNEFIRGKGRVWGVVWMRWLWEDIQAMGKTRPCGLPYTLDQIRRALVKLEAYGFVTRRRMPYNEMTKSSAVYIRLNSLHMLKVIKDLHNDAKRSITPEEGGTLKPKAKAAPKKPKTSSNTSVTAASAEAGGCGIKAHLLLNTEGVEDLMDVDDDVPASSSSTNDDFEAVGFASGPGDPILEGTPAVKAIAQLLRGEFPAVTWTFKLNTAIRNWVCCGSDRGRMTVELMKQYIDTRGTYTLHDDWYWTCDLSELLRRWPEVKQGMLSEVADPEITQKWIDTRQLDQSTVAYFTKKFVQTQSWMEAGKYSTRPYASPELVTDYMAAHCISRQDMLAEMKAFQMDDVRIAFRQNPDLALCAITLMPELVADLNLRPGEITAMHQRLERDGQIRHDLHYAADILGIPTQNYDP